MRTNSWATWGNLHKWQEVPTGIGSCRVSMPKLLEQAFPSVTAKAKLRLRVRTLPADLTMPRYYKLLAKEFEGDMDPRQDTAVYGLRSIVREGAHSNNQSLAKKFSQLCCLSRCIDTQVRNVALPEASFVHIAKTLENKHIYSQTYSRGFLNLKPQSLERSYCSSSSARRVVQGSKILHSCQGFVKRDCKHGLAVRNEK